MLELYAQAFGAVEIDSTYYAIPKRSLFENMARRTPADFRFCVKAPGSVTHAPADGRPPDDDANAFADSIEPLVAARKLGAILVQFPHSFRPDSGAQRRLSAMRRWWPDLPLVAEFRHRAWQHAETEDLLRDLGIGLCNVDEPRLSTLMRPGAEVTSPIGYVRFHGRNSAQWWRQDRTPGARYDYLYREEELVEWLPRISEIESQTRETYVFFNNHRLGKAARNASEMSRMLGVGRGPRQERLF